MICSAMHAEESVIVRLYLISERKSVATSENIAAAYSFKVPKNFVRMMFSQLSTITDN